MSGSSSLSGDAETASAYIDKTPDVPGKVLPPPPPSYVTPPGLVLPMAPASHQSAAAGSTYRSNTVRSTTAEDACTSPWIEGGLALPVHPMLTLPKKPPPLKIPPKRVPSRTPKRLNVNDLPQLGDDAFIATRNKLRKVGKETPRPLPSYRATPSARARSSILEGAYEGLRRSGPSESARLGLTETSRVSDAPRPDAITPATSAQTPQSVESANFFGINLFGHLASPERPSPPGELNA